MSPSALTSVGAAAFAYAAIFTGEPLSGASWAVTPEPRSPAFSVTFGREVTGMPLVAICRSFALIEPDADAASAFAPNGSVGTVSTSTSPMLLVPAGSWASIVADAHSRPAEICSIS
jgi:hypothetical protein